MIFHILYLHKFLIESKTGVFFRENLSKSVSPRESCFLRTRGGLKNDPFPQVEMNLLLSNSQCRTWHWADTL